EEVEPQIRLVAQVRANFYQAVRRDFDPRVQRLEVRPADLLTEAFLQPFKKGFAAHWINRFSNSRGVEHLMQGRVDRLARTNCTRCNRTAKAGGDDFVQQAFMRSAPAPPRRWIR